MGWFRKGRELWFVDCKEGYALCIHAEMYMAGTYMNVFVHYGSFWNDVKAGPYGVSLGSSYWIDCHSHIPFNTICFETSEELEDIVRRSAPVLVDAMKEKVLPILRTIHDLTSFVAASEQLDTLLKLYNKQWRRTQVWDYLALGRREDAMAHLDRLALALARASAGPPGTAAPGEAGEASPRYPGAYRKNGADRTRNLRAAGCVQGGDRRDSARRHAPRAAGAPRRLRGSPGCSSRPAPLENPMTHSNGCPRHPGAGSRSSYLSPPEGHASRTP